MRSNVTADSPSPRPDYARLLAGHGDLRGRIAFVPGGYGGIGAAIAWGLALAGARVIVAGRNAARPKRSRPSSRAAGHDAIGLAMDAHSIAEHPRRGRRGRDRASAASTSWSTASASSARSALLDVTEDAFDEVVQVNLKAAMFLGQAVARHQIAGAAAGRAGGRQRAPAVGAGAARHARSRLLRVLRTKGGAGDADQAARDGAVARHGITVNGVAPTVVRGEMAPTGSTIRSRASRSSTRIPLGRVAEPDDVVGAALFFCARPAAFVTGQMLYIDGGLTASQ